MLDVRLPPTQTDEGLRAAIAVREARPGFPVMVLSQYVEQLYARELLASGVGAVGYLLKDRVSDVAEFVDGVRRVAAGGTVLDPEVVATVMARQRDEPLERLTPREREVLGLMAEGRSNAAIAGAPARHREGRRQAHQQHLHEARPAHRRGRPPPGPGRARLAAGLDEQRPYGVTRSGGIGGGQRGLGGVLALVHRRRSRAAHRPVVRRPQPSTAR